MLTSSWKDHAQEHSDPVWRARKEALKIWATKFGAYRLLEYLGDVYHGIIYLSRDITQSSCDDLSSRNCEQQR